MATTKKAAPTVKTVSHAKPKATAKKKPTAKEQAAASVAKMRQASLAIAPCPTPSELVMMPLTLIETRTQVRTEFNDETLVELAADIAANGVMQPILLRPNPGKVNFLVIAGERRFRAAQLAQLENIPAIIGEVSDEHASAMQIAENIQREDLSLADTAAAVRKLYELNNNSVTDVAAKLHKSKSWVSKHLAASCPNLRYMAKEIIEGGYTEDLEIILVLDKFQQLDWYSCSDLCKKIKKGEAGRQTVREAYEASKKKIEEDAARRQAENNKKETDEERTKREAEHEEWKATRKAEAEKRRLDPLQIRWKIDHNAQSEPDNIEELTQDELDAIGAHLANLYKKANGAGPEEFRAKLIQMDAEEINSDGYAMIEKAAYVAGYFGEGFNLAKLIEEMNKNVREVCA